MMILVQSENYEKAKFKDLETNEIQYMEYIKNKDGTSKYIISDHNENITNTIESNKKEVILRNKDDQIIDRIDRGQEMTEISFDSIGLTASWGPKRPTQGSRNTNYGNVLIVYGIIAALVSAPPGVTAILTVASYIVNNKIRNVWYKGWYRTKWEDGLRYTQTYLNLYRNSNFTGFIKVVQYIDFH